MIRVNSIHRPTTSLKPQELDELWALYAPHHNISREDFERRLHTQLHTVTLFRARRDDRLLGATAVRAERFTLSDGTTLNTIYSGMSYIDRSARGLHLLPRTLIYHTMKLRASAPHLPVYLWSDAISYKPYVTTARSTRRFYPSRHEPTPAHVQELINLVGQRFYGERFDLETGTVQKPQNRLKDHVAPLNERDLEDPDIRFFAERNPRYMDGHGLINVIPITMANIMTSAFNAGLRAARAAIPARTSSQSKKVNP